MRQKRDLIQIEPNNVLGQVWYLCGFTVQYPRDHLEIRRPFGNDHAKLGQVPAQRVDQLGTLPDKALVGPDAIARTWCSAPFTAT